MDRARPLSIWLEDDLPRTISTKNGTWKSHLDTNEAGPVDGKRLFVSSGAGCSP
jgi:hypothetical protein